MPATTGYSITTEGDMGETMKNTRFIKGCILLLRGIIILLEIVLNFIKMMIILPFGLLHNLLMWILIRGKKHISFIDNPMHKVKGRFE
jgi:hypothetical protein